MENTLPTQPAGSNPASAAAQTPTSATPANPAQPSVQATAAVPAAQTSAQPNAQPAATTPQPAPAAAAQTSATQLAAPAAQSNKKPGKLDQVKILTISLVVLGALILVLGATNIIALLISRGDNIPVANTSDPNAGSSEPVEPEKNEPVEKKPLEELTKDEALAIFQNMNKVNYAPDGFFDPVMEQKLIGHYYTVGESYGFLDDIEEKDTMVSNAGVYDLDIEEVDDTYAVYYPMQDGKRIDSLTMGIAFEKSHLNYYKEKVIDTDEDGYASISYKNVARYKDLSADFIKKSMPVLAVADGVVNTGSVYDFAFSEDDEKVLLTLYNIKANITGENPTEDSTGYELVLYIDECYIDKDTFEFGWITDEYGRVDYIINSFPLEEAEFNSLAGGE